MTVGRQVRSLEASELQGIVDPCLIADWLLGANLAARTPPEDPDDRQYWLWDVDELEEEEEPCPP
jgi:hypothetical protein